ncbi:hypothetical protein NDU88_002975 [Pleurodeles waltl]|uniref:LITAF domain-containing protein n=1 Tax=Pleurodeles waltl TaxID=8319 RepID=A0AAV7M409_PLEWA|nr:hypothetical protein NDU88_002975 [Pleurodeles waltl]
MSDSQRGNCEDSSWGQHNRPDHCSDAVTGIEGGEVLCALWLLSSYSLLNTTEDNLPPLKMYGQQPYVQPYQVPGYAPPPQPAPYYPPQVPVAPTGQNQTVIMQPPSVNQTVILGRDSGQDKSSDKAERGYNNPGGPAVMIGNQNREIPMRTTCPACQQPIVTSISYTNGTQTWLLCILMAIFGLVLGCCLIPFFVDSCKDVDHYCPSCNHLVCKHKRMG